MRRIVELGAAFVVGAAAVELGRRGFEARRVEVRPKRSTSAERVPDEAATSSDREAATSADRSGRTARGREAERPAEIPAQGWKDIVVRAWKEFGDDQIPLIAAGCTFYVLLALFPAVTAFVALYGLFADVAAAQTHVQTLSGILPAGAISLIDEQMVKVAAAGSEGLSFAFVLGLVTALWSANKAMKAVITGLNIAYEETEKRNLVVKTLVPLGFTLGFVVLAVVAMALGALGTAVSARFGGTLGLVYSLVYWAILLTFVILGMAMVYRYGPSRSLAKWRWISWGSGLAAVAWIAMSAGFTFYVANFGKYDESYGALGAAIGFMTWIWLSSMVFLMGAELNAEMEHQTRRDTTTGAPRPLGARGAVMADSVGAAV